MTFTELFNKYYNDLKCNNNQFSKITNISPSTLNKIRNGEKTSSLSSDEIFSICKGFTIISGIGNIKLNFDDLYKEFSTAASYCQMLDFLANKHFIRSLNDLLDKLDIKNSKLARALKLDPSYISRIREGKRELLNKEKFVSKLENYLLDYYLLDEHIQIYSSLFKVSLDEFKVGNFSKFLKLYLFEVNQETKDSVNEFIGNLNYYIESEKDFEFNYNDYFATNNQENYYGLEEAEKSVLDFFIQVLESDSTADIIIYNNYGGNEKKQNDLFLKRWYFLIDKIIKKGHKIFKIHVKNNDQIHFINEMKFWVPIYLKGHAFPYLIEDYNNYLTKTLLYTADDICALSGETSVNPSETLLFRTNKNDVVSYYTKKNHSFLNMASVMGKTNFLFDEKSYFEAIKLDNLKNGDWLGVLFHPSLLAIPPNILTQILARSNLSLKIKNDILVRINKFQKNSELLLKIRKISEFFPFLTKEEFEKSPVKLALNRIYFDENLFYEYEEYLEHLKSLEKFCKKHNNYSYVLLNKPYFESIEMFVHANKFVVAMDIKPPLKTISFYGNTIMEGFGESRDIFSSYILKDKNPK